MGRKSFTPLYRWGERVYPRGGSLSLPIYCTVQGNCEGYTFSPHLYGGVKQWGVLSFSHLYGGVKQWPPNSFTPPYRWEKEYTPHSFTPP